MSDSADRNPAIAMPVLAAVKRFDFLPRMPIDGPQTKEYDMVDLHRTVVPSVVLLQALVFETGVSAEAHKEFSVGRLSLCSF